MAKKKKAAVKNGTALEKLSKCAVFGGALGLAVIFAATLWMTQLLPGRYLAVVCICMLIVLGALALLLWNRKKRLVHSGMFLGVLIAILLLLGIIAAGRGLSALNVVTNPNSEVVETGVYVRMDDPAVTLEDLKGYTFGIMGTLDRKTVDKSIRKIESRLGGELQISEYGSPAALVNALLGDEVDVIVLNTAYLEILEETESYEDLTDRIREIEIITVESDTAPGSGDSYMDTLDPFTVYISGVDSRTGLSTRSRSDVNIIATVNPQTRQILLVSTPRDYVVPLSISDGNRDKLTHAGIYGVQVSIDTMAMLYDIPIDYYFRVNFEGFKNIVDSLGGVTIYSDYEFTAYKSPYHFVIGRNDLNGEQALAYARERKSFPTGDRQRGQNQMALIRAIIAKVQSVEALKNYMSLMSAVEGSFETSVPYDLLAALVRDQLDKGGEWNVVTYSVNGADSSEVTWSQGFSTYVMIPYEDMVATASDLMERVRSGEIVEAP